MDRERTRSRAGGRDTGIALMVVMVVFIILYLVVFQLHYTTKLEEKLSKARSADVQGSVAIRSIAYSIMSQLAEDFQTGNEQAAGGAAAPAEAPGGETRGGGETQRKEGQSRPMESSAGSDPTQAAAGAGAAGGAGGPTWHDYLRKNIFLDNRQSLNGVNVKILTIDNERCFDLNRLWSYAPSSAETLSETNRQREESRARSKSEDGTGKSQKDKLSRINRQRKAKAGRDAGVSGTAPPTAEEILEEAVVGEGEDSDEWIPPTEERRRETTVMLERAIDMMYRLNTEKGFDYKRQPPQPAVLASAIERYAFDRRSQNFQSYIHLTSELLNVLAALGESPEVYYGPMPDLQRGEEFIDRDQEFRYQKDEYGDLVGEYLYAEDLTLEREMMQEQLTQLQGTFGEFADFNRLGITDLGRMGSPMTRNMTEYSEVEDESGNVSLMVPPLPIGLRDLFTTYSTGKINLNTAPVPVLYALLPLIHGEPEGPFYAQKIAINIAEYRDSYQPEYDDTDPLFADRKTATADAPHRRPPAEGTGGRGARGKAGAKAAADLLSSTGVASAAGMTQEELAAAASGASSDYPTNYFTNLSQLKLIDGEDGGKLDYLSDRDAGADTADLQSKTPLQKVMHDYGQVMVFGSTYFTATLKSKAEDSGHVKTGYLTMIRDVRRRRIDVLQWKELQK